MGLTPQQAVDLTREAMGMILLLAGPLLLVGLIVALVVSLLQAVTQLHDFTLSFVPRLLAVGLAALLLASWMLTRLSDYTVQLFRSIVH